MPFNLLLQFYDSPDTSEEKNRLELDPAEILPIY